jgi:MFS family permease
MNLIERAKNIMMTPAKEWDVVNGEEANVPGIITGYVIPLAGAAAAAAFIGYGFIGAAFRSGISWGIYQAVLVIVGALAGVFISAFVIDSLAPSFGSEKNMAKSVQLVAYSYTPGWVGGLLAIIPLLGILGGLLGLYGFYLMYLGLPKLKKTPQDKHVSYFVVSLVVMFVVYLVIAAILAAILMPAFGISAVSRVGYGI